MDDLGFQIEIALSWFPHEKDTPYTLVRVNEEDAESWVEVLRDAFRRAYLTDDFLDTRAQEIEPDVGGTREERQGLVIRSKLPDPGPVMSGDFGEILLYFYQAVEAHPQIAFGPKKWRLKEGRTRPAPYSDVVQFILPEWPASTESDEILCAEVKTKATGSNPTPIKDAIEGSSKDHTGRLAKTLVWLKERAISENLGSVKIAHLDRFINATDHPAATKHFHAVLVICSSLAEAELVNAPATTPDNCALTIIVVPGLKALYMAVYEAVKESSLPEEPL